MSPTKKQTPSNASLFGRRWIPSALMSACIILALPPFFGLQYSFWVGDYDLAVFKSLGHHEPPDLIAQFIGGIVSVSQFPSRVIANVFPIEGVTIFAGEGLVAPKPLVTVVFWLATALLIFVWTRRTTIKAVSPSSNPTPNN